MTDTTRSTLVQLLFRASPQVDFPRIVSDLERALASCLPDGGGMVWDHDDFAQADLPGGRVTLAWATGLEGPHEACLTIAIGPGALPAAPGEGLVHRQGAVARMVADRIASRHAPDTQRWHRPEGAVTVDLVDALTESLAHLDLGGATPAEATSLSLAGLAHALTPVLAPAAAPSPVAPRRAANPTARRPQAVSALQRRVAAALGSVIRTPARLAAP